MTSTSVHTVLSNWIVNIFRYLTVKEMVFSFTLELRQKKNFVPVKLSKVQDHCTQWYVDRSKDAKYCLIRSCNQSVITF